MINFIVQCVEETMCTLHFCGSFNFLVSKFVRTLIQPLQWCVLSSSHTHEAMRIMKLVFIKLDRWSDRFYLHRERVVGSGSLTLQRAFQFIERLAHLGFGSYSAMTKGKVVIGLTQHSWDPSIPFSVLFYLSISLNQFILSYYLVFWFIQIKIVIVITKNKSWDKR